MVVGDLSMACLSAIEKVLCAKLVLPFLDPKLSYTEVTDASRTTVGGVLMQDLGNGL